MTLINHIQSCDKCNKIRNIERGCCSFKILCKFIVSKCKKRKSLLIQSYNISFYNISETRIYFLYINMKLKLYPVI